MCDVPIPDNNCQSHSIIRSHWRGKEVGGEWKMIIKETDNECNRCNFSQVIYIYIYDWIQVTLSVILNNVTPFNIFLIEDKFW